MKHLTLFGFFLLSSIVTLYSQSIRIKGEVVDAKTKKGVAYATVSWMSYPRGEVAKILATEKNGQFSVDLPFGTYFMNISAVGYKKAEAVVSPRNCVETSENLWEKDFGLIEMVEQPIELDEFIVKPIVEISSDEIVYNLDQDPDRETSTLHEILDKVPMVGRTPDNKLFVDNPNTTFLVVRNGKVDALFSGKDINQILKAIPAKAFGKVRLMLLPPERFGDYDYVLNIETDERNVLFGMVGQSSSELDLSLGQLQVDQRVIGNLEKMRFSAGFYLAGSRMPVKKKSLEYLYSSQDLYLMQEQSDRSSDRSGGVSAMFSYDISKQQFLTGQVLYLGGNTKSTSTLNNLRVFDALEEAYEVDTKQRLKSRRYSGELNWQYDFTGRKRVLNLAYKFLSIPESGYSRAGISGDFQETEIPMSSNNRDESKEHTVQIHYFDPLSSLFRLETGAGYIFRDYYTSGDYFYDMIASAAPAISSSLGKTEMKSKKHIVNAYGELGFTKKRVSALMKVRVDYQNDGDGTLVKDLNGQEDRISETGLDVVPEINVSLSYPERKVNSLSFRYFQRKYRPSIHHLSSIRDYSNPNLIKQGNPLLKNQTQHSFSLSTSLISRLSLSVGYSYSGDMISPYLYKDENNVIISSYRNYGKYQSVYFNLSSMYRLKSLMVMGAVMGSCSSRNTGRGESSRNILIPSSLNIMYTFKNGISLNSMVSYTYTHNTGYNGSKITPFGLSFMARKSFLKGRLEMEAKLKNVLDTRSRVTDVTNASEFTLYQRMEQRVLPFLVNVRLMIGSFKVKAIKTARKGAIIDDVKTD